MSRKLALPILAALAITALPLFGGQALATQAVTFNGTTINFPINSDGGPNASGCSGTLVPVYGSAAIKTYIIDLAKKYCSDTTNNPNRYDVEYVSSDSCPGDQFAVEAANNPAKAQNHIGVSTLFPTTCSVASSAVQTQVVAVNVVNLITTCPNATGVQNSTGAHPCQGSEGYQVGFDCSTTFPTLSDYQFVAPPNLSQDQTRLVLENQVADMSLIGGTQCSPEVIQQRIPGAGDRNTICDVVFESLSGTTNCVANAQGDSSSGSANGPAKGTSDMLTDICGTATGTTPSNGTNPAANAGANPESNGVYPLGYVSRASVVVDSRSAVTAPFALGGCGLIQYQGFDGYNRGCVYTNLAPNTTYSNINIDGQPICSGDLQVALNQYTIWGYAQIVEPTNPGMVADAFYQWVKTHTTGSDTITQSTGFIRKCQMNYVRSIDGGPVSGTSSSC